MKRRSFIKNTSLFTLPAFFGGINVTASASSMLSSMINGDSDKVLILIDLNGGNDGLNTFVPLDGYDNLVNARQNVVLPENQLLDFTNNIGLHPSMGGVKQLYDDAKLTVVQGVAYPNQNRSHFRSADIWNTASAADEYKTNGWIGRYLDDTFPGYPQDYPNTDCPDPFSVSMGSKITSTCQGAESNFAMAIINANNIGGLNIGIEAPLPNDCYGEEMGYLVESFKKTNVYGDRVLEAVGLGNSLSNLYPANNSLAQQFKVVAQLISGGLQSKIYVLRLGGFDTHANQVEGNSTTSGWHAQLLETLSDAIHAFQDDLKLLDLEERVMGMTFSEFGRKIKSNAATGTDHGTAAPMMIFGSCVNAGIIGDNPTIGTNVDINEGVAMQYDFRSVYGSVLMDWFEVEESKVQELLTFNFQYIPIVGSCEVVSTKEIIPELDVKALPNPFRNSFVLEFSLLQNAAVRIDLFDVVGKQVKTISNKSFTNGEHRVPVEAHELAAGIYFVRMEVGKGVKTLRVVKQ